MHPRASIAIDTGESVQEMTVALAALREQTNRPIAAAIHTHFHYVAGKKALDADSHLSGYPVWGHERPLAPELARAEHRIAMFRQ